MLIFFSSSYSTLWTLLPFWGIRLIFQFLDHFTDGRIPWTGDQLVARPLPIYRITQTQKNAHTHTPNIHALSVIRTHDPDFRSSEDSTCLRPLGYHDQRVDIRVLCKKKHSTRWLQVFLILPVDGSANKALSVVSYRNFHQNSLLRGASEIWALTLLNTGLMLWFYDSSVNYVGPLVKKQKNKNSV
jgi:hypothetical protein